MTTFQPPPQSPADIAEDVSSRIPAPHYSTLIGGPAPSGTVLVVDDERTVRVAIRHVLQKYGYTVLDAASADDALQLVRDQMVTIDLIVTDIVMPGMTGVELVKLVMQDVEIPVIYISGYVSSSDLRDEGVSADHWLLAKPVYPATLMAAVQGALAYGTSTIGDIRP